MPDESKNNAIQRRSEDSKKKRDFFELDCPDFALQVPNFFRENRMVWIMIAAVPKTTGKELRAMQITNRITPAVIQAATAMLSPDVPEISPQSLMAALRAYKIGESPKVTRQAEPFRQGTAPESGHFFVLGIVVICRQMIGVK